jgi:hypothetical protein
VIFRQEMIDAIMSGRKTVTRRPLTKHPVTGNPSDQFACRYEVGKDYAIQPGRGKRQVARLRVKSVEKWMLGVTNEGEAVLEGFPSRDAFEAYWRKLYGGFDPGQLVHRIEFELIPVEVEGA